MKDRVKRLVDRVGGFVDRRVAGSIDPRQQLILSGYWRSGTTWLQQSTAALLQAKTVFEPLRPDQAPAASLYSAVVRDLGGAPLLALTMPFLEGKLDPGSAAYSCFREALVGGIPGPWVRHLRSTVSESFRRRVVVKLVRGALNLGAIQATFRVPVLHLRRNPHAVLASIKRIRWPGFLGDMEQLSLDEQLLVPEDGRRRFFEAYREPIGEFDARLGKEERMIAYRALIEAYVDEHSRRTESPFALLDYDKLLEGKTEYLSEKLESVGICDIDEDAARISVLRDSRTTTLARQGVSDATRRSSWTGELTSEEIERVDWIQSTVAGVRESLPGA